MRGFDPTVLDACNPSPMTGAGNHTYLLTGGDGAATLIDAGVGEPRHLAALATALDRERAQLAVVIVTHGHADHASGAPTIGAAHPTARFLKHPWPGYDDQYRVEWQTVRDGDVIALGAEHLTLLHMPGHSPDHIVVWHERSRTMFTGDLVAAGSSVMIHTSRGGSLADYMRSLERIRQLEPRVLFPAHGPRVDDPAALVTQYLEHRRLRERQVVDALRAGRDTVEAIAQSIYDGIDAALMPAARENVRAHLEKLRDDGRVSRELDRWRI